MRRREKEKKNEMEGKKILDTNTQQIRVPLRAAPLLFLFD